MKITKRAIDDLEWNGKQSQIEYDDELKGFGVRVYPSGIKSFVVSVYPKHSARRRIVVLGRVGVLTVKQARAEAIQHLAAAAHGIDLVGEKEVARQAEEARVSLAEAATDYLDRVSMPGQKASWKQDQQILRKDVLPVLGKVPLEEITRAHVSRVIDRVLARGARHQANRTLACVRVVLSHAVDRGWLEANPCFRMKQPCKEAPRRRFLSEEEILIFWQATADLREITGSGFRLMLLTGQRPIRETLGMRWEELELDDPDDAWWHLPAERTKSARANLVPLSPLAVAELEAVRRRDLPGPYVFPSLFKSVDAPISDAAQPRRKLCRLCGFDFQLKDLRRTVASHLPRLGCSRFVVARILNHADSSVTGRHYDLFEYAPDKKAALDAWGRHLQRLIAGEIEATPSFRRAPVESFAERLLDDGHAAPPPPS